MTSQPVRAAVRFHKRDRPTTVPGTVAAGQPGLVLQDIEGDEHHFGGGALEAAGGSTVMTYSYAASYSSSGRDELRPSQVYERLRSVGVKVASAHIGPLLEPIVRAALACLVEACNTNNGFAFPYEKELAVETFLALRDYAHASYDPDEIEVWGATNGWSLEHAADLGTLAAKVQQRRTFRPAIRLRRDQAEKMIAHWRRRSDT